MNCKVHALRTKHFALFLKMQISTEEIDHSDLCESLKLSESGSVEETETTIQWNLYKWGVEGVRKFFSIQNSLHKWGMGKPSEGFLGDEMN